MSLIVNNILPEINSKMKKFLEKYSHSYSEPNQNINKETFQHKYHAFSFIYDLIYQYGGDVFDNGLFKIHTFAYLEKWTNLITNHYFKKEIEGQELICFASNWQGCMYCVNSANNLITYFDPATCDFFSADNTSITNFFDNVLVDGEFDIIFEDYFKEVMGYLNSSKLNYDESIGHKIFLHLGGEDNIENLAMINTEVLWDLQIQVAERINDLPD